ncbi:MAG: Uma2 family endonuclease [Oscillospiraceae bacterium]|nr:Uma2 family endonuclease [Oscillospiraceae bacterium]
MMPELDKNKRYTYADYLTWDEDFRCELIDGIVYAMAPSPAQGHQDTSGELFGQLWSFLRDKHCKVYHAPFDVRLSSEESGGDTVVQPDIFVVCDHDKLDGKRCNGAPDFVIEVISPSSATRDTVIKLHQYMHAGVREYWIVDPELRVLQVGLLQDGRYITQDFIHPGIVPVTVLEGCEIDFSRVFPD